MGGARHSHWGRFACSVLETGLVRGSGGAGGRLVKLWTQGAAPFVAFEDLKPLALKILEFEGQQEHRQLDAAAKTLELHEKGLLGSPYDIDWAAAAALPFYVAPKKPPPRPDPEDEEGGGGQRVQCAQG